MNKIITDLASDIAYELKMLPEGPQKTGLPPNAQGPTTGGTYRLMDDVLRQ